jgi:hypothetical protein
MKLSTKVENTQKFMEEHLHASTWPPWRPCTGDIGQQVLARHCSTFPKLLVGVRPKPSPSLLQCLLGVWGSHGFLMKPRTKKLDGGRSVGGQSISCYWRFGLGGHAPPGIISLSKKRGLYSWTSEPKRLHRTLYRQPCGWKVLDLQWGIPYEVSRDRHS